MKNPIFCVLAIFAAAALIITLTTMSAARTSKYTAPPSYICMVLHNIFGSIFNLDVAIAPLDFSIKLILATMISLVSSNSSLFS